MTVAGPAACARRDRPWEAVLSAAWAGRPAADVDDACLRRAARLAADHHLDDAFVRCYRDRLPAEAERWDALAAAFDRSLREAVAVLASAGVEPTLIKAETADYRYGNFDLLIGAGEWAGSIAAFRSARWALERTLMEPHKVLARPASGPAAHVHGAVSWFGIPVIPVERIRMRRVRVERFPVPIPAEVDRLRVWLAHACFQNLALGLSELVAVRPLLRDDLVGWAREEAGAEGWRGAFAAAVEVAAAAARRLDRGEHVGFPLRLPAGASLVTGFQHAARLAAGGHPILAAREVALRPLLVLAKLRPGRAGIAT